MATETLSIIIPAYNEEARLCATLTCIHSFMRKRSASFELIVVDDGSTDRTCEIARDFANLHEQTKLVSYKANRGKGFAVRQGVFASTGDLILFCDADGSTPIEEIDALILAIDEGADLAFGSRNMPDPVKSVRTSQHRKLIGNTFNLFVQRLLLPGIADTQCGFKLFKRQAALSSFRASKIDRFAFDVEILYLAKMHGFRIREIAINWTNAPGSKVNLVTDPLSMACDLLRIAITSRRRKSIDKPIEDPSFAFAQSGKAQLLEKS